MEWFLAPQDVVSPPEAVVGVRLKVNSIRQSSGRRTRRARPEERSQMVEYASNMRGIQEVGGVAGYRRHWRPDERRERDGGQVEGNWRGERVDR